ncbi:MAG: FixH family protein [Archangium sp.]|nr:FixH family protein [Archangium sp.]
MRRLSLVSSLLALVACGPEPVTQQPPARLVLASTSVALFDAELASTATLGTGLTTVWLTLRDHGAPVTDATVTLQPLMTMPTKSHACPVVGEVVHEGNGVYRGQLVFQMPSADMGTWSLSAKVLRGGAESKLTFDALAVGDSGLARSFVASDVKYVMSVSYPEALKVGLNPVVVTLHRMQDMMTFPAFDDATLEMVPEMPAHGHGSSNNVAPVLKAPGRYEGVVNYSMLGDWKTTFTVKAAGAVMTTVSIDTKL